MADSSLKEIEVEGPGPGSLAEWEILSDPDPAADNESPVFLFPVERPLPNSSVSVPGPGDEEEAVAPHSEDEGSRDSTMSPSLTENSFLQHLMRTMRNTRRALTYGQEVLGFGVETLAKKLVRLETKIDSLMLSWKCVKSQVQKLIDVVNVVPVPASPRPPRVLPVRRPHRVRVVKDMEKKPKAGGSG